MASKIPTSPDAAPPGAHQEWRGLGRKLPAFKRKEDSVFLDARLPAHEQAKNIVFKYSSDGDFFYNSNCTGSEVLKKQTSAPTALKSKFSNRSCCSCNTEKDIRVSSQKSVKGNGSIMFGSRSHTHMGSSSTVASGNETENTPRCKDVQEERKTEEIRSKPIESGEVARSESNITQCMDRDCEHEKDEGHVLDIQKILGNVRLSPSDTKQTLRVGFKVVSSNSTTNTNGDDAEGTNGNQSGTAAPDRQHDSKGIEEQKSLLDNIDVKQQSSSASVADSLLSSTTTAAEGEQNPFSKAAPTTLVPFRTSIQQEHVRIQEQNKVEESARVKDKEDFDADIEFALFNDDATWERLIAGLAQFRVK